MLFAEYYAYQEPGEPKIVVRPENGSAYRTIPGEAETLWANSRPALMD